MDSLLQKKTPREVTVSGLLREHVVWYILHAFESQGRLPWPSGFQGITSILVELFPSPPAVLASTRTCMAPVKVTSVFRHGSREKTRSSPWMAEMSKWLGECAKCIPDCSDLTGRVKQGHQPTCSGHTQILSLLCCAYGWCYCPCHHLAFLAELFQRWASAWGKIEGNLKANVSNRGQKGFPSVGTYAGDTAQEFTT